MKRLVGIPEQLNTRTWAKMLLAASDENRIGSTSELAQSPMSRRIVAMGGGESSQRRAGAWRALLPYRGRQGGPVVEKGRLAPIPDSSFSFQHPHKVERSLQRRRAGGAARGRGLAAQAITITWAVGMVWVDGHDRTGHPWTASISASHTRRRRAALCGDAGSAVIKT